MALGGLSGKTAPRIPLVTTEALGGKQAHSDENAEKSANYILGGSAIFKNSCHKINAAVLAHVFLGLGVIFCWLVPAIADAAVYTIQPGDQLRVLVFGSQGIGSIQVQGQQAAGTIQELSQSVTVLSDGTITYPLIGSIVVAGSSPEAAAQRISAALAAYVVHPKVSVIVEKGMQATVKVLGSVDHGGQIDLQQGDRLADALAKAGVGPKFVLPI